MLFLSLSLLYLFMKTIFTIFLICFSYQSLFAQKCTTRGQTPETAFPICAKDTFHQKSVPVCTNGHVAVPGCDPVLSAGGYQAKNPFWYKFTCYKSGTLSFLITPNDLGDDYDWQLYDITGHEAKDVLTDQSLVVTGNWAGTYGLTGAKANGVNFIQCASNPLNNEPTFAKSPVIKKNHTYLLMVSHFSGSNQSGYDLTFKGGTAIIIDTTQPRLIKATASCDGSIIGIKLNKNMLCKSLAADGSDFIIASGAANVIAASSVDCSGFDMDSLTITLDRFLPEGNYTVAIQNGKDKNTLLDDCGTAIPEGDKLDFTIQKVPSTPMDSIPFPGCAPASVHVVFDGPMRCGSVAADGSDFKITGPSQVVVTGAKGVNCQNSLSDTIKVTLAAPIEKGGHYTLSLQRGSDGNTILNECAQPTPTGSSLTFDLKDTVSAAFSYRVKYTCEKALVSLQNKGGNGIDQWNWTLGNGLTGSLSKLIYEDTTFKPQLIKLFVSNGVCTDSATASFTLNKDFYVKADFEMPEFVCPNDEATFIDHCEGNIVSRKWDFGNGQTSFLKIPPKQHYPVVIRTKDFPVRLTVENVIGCKDTIVKQLKVINNCFIAVPTAFTPNGDGMNDYLYPLNAYKARDLDFRIYNRYGQKVFETKNWTQKWDGTFHGEKQPTGSYVWMLTYINTDTEERVFKKGATLLIR